LKDNAILIILLIFLIMTSLFWFQLWNIKDLPTNKDTTPPAVTSDEAEAFINLAQELLIEYKEPLVDLRGRDPFFMEDKSNQNIVKENPVEQLMLSSIIYNDLSPYAVINGKIFAEGDKVYDLRSGDEFLIENIEINKVEISDGKSVYNLEMGGEGSRL